jgi:hypothetical protein
MKKLSTFFLLIAFGFELICLIKGVSWFGAKISSLIFFIAGLLIALAPVFFLEKRRTISPFSFHLPVHRYFIPATIFLLLSIFCLLFSRGLKKYPVDINYSDILPTIDTMASRFLADGIVYDRTITYPTYQGGYPGYLPMHWLPTVISKAAGADIRWGIAGVFIAGLIIVCFWLKNKLFSLVPLIVSIVLLAYMTQVLVSTAELMIAAYYFILCTGIIKKNRYLILIGIVSCLLSRYSLVLWLPAYFFLFWLNEGKKKSNQLFWRTLLFIAVLFIFPFFLQNPSAFLASFKSYSQIVPLFEWSGQHWQGPGDKPYQLFQGLGLACFIYDYIAGSISYRINLTVTLQIVFSALAVLLSMLWYFRVDRKKMDYAFFSLLLLKFYFCFFYGFIAVPYAYLFITPLFVSLIIVLYVFYYNLGYGLPKCTTKP